MWRSTSCLGCFVWGMVCWELSYVFWTTFNITFLNFLRLLDLGNAQWICLLSPLQCLIVRGLCLFCRWMKNEWRFAPHYTAGLCKIWRGVRRVHLEELHARQCCFMVVLILYMVNIKVWMCTLQGTTGIWWVKSCGVDGCRGMTDRSGSRSASAVCCVVTIA